MLAAEAALDRACASAPRHHNSVATIGGAADAFLELVLVLDENAARREFPVRGGEIGSQARIIGEANG